MGLELGKSFIDRYVDTRSGAFAYMEDFADRLSHFFSCGLILMLAGVTMTNVYFLRPISCTLPTAPDNQFNIFAESVCWVKGTIGLHDTDLMPMSSEDWSRARQRSDISFYQWVPFCLSVQAMLFLLPHIIWQSFVQQSFGEHFESILTKVRQANAECDGKKRTECIEVVAGQLLRITKQRRDKRSVRRSSWQHQTSEALGGTATLMCKRKRNWITVAHLFVKFLYLTNAIGQLHIIRTFLGFQGNILNFGNKLANTLVSKHEWGESEFFPRQTYCPVTVRHLGTKNNVYTAICALPVNIFNEKIYIFLWAWIAGVSVITAVSLIIWLIRAVRQSCQADFVREFLLQSLLAQKSVLLDEHPAGCVACQVNTKDPDLEDFFDEVVHNDGTFLLRMMRSNAGDVITWEIISAWWHLFIKLKRQQCVQNKTANVPVYTA